MQQQINIKYQVRTKELKISHCKGPSIYITNRKDKQGFPGSSVSKESACNAGDQGSIPGSGRSLGEGNGNLLQYFA